MFCHPQRQALLVGLLAASLFLPACQKGGNVTVTGRVLRNSQPIPLSKTGVVQVTLIPDVGPDEQYTTYVGRCDETGKFEVFDVPPGKYRISIEVLDPTPQNDKLNGAFAFANSKFKRDIDGKAPLAIDLAKPGS